MESRSNVEQIAELVKKSYFKLSKSSRPTTRSNGILEGTIVASVIACDINTGSTRLISIATGVKSTPNSELKRSHGKIVHDCHAEILALRGLNAVILKQIQYLKQGQNSDLVVKSGVPGKFKWKENLELALFISKLPCGDASMRTLEESSRSDDIQYSDSDENQYLDPNIRTILRGRSNYKRRGYVRTKPGRIDSKITHSISCSDKLCARQSTSVLNALNFTLLEVPIYLKYLVVPNLTNDELEYARSSLHNRIPDKNHLLNIITCKFDFEDDLNELKEPSPLCGVKLYYTTNDTIEEQILNGLKNGYYTKPSKPIRKNAESTVSRYSLWKCFVEMCPEFKDISYQSFKKAYCNDRKLNIDKVRNVLSPDGWVYTYADDFSI
ncbi:tRNA-specific adenosine deaminase 1 [Nakaseomyces bracarensis]|uniref:tRNA-specific adenosine deaminase 1 n=1 Tax=Nakaseomyces bracarensis TaxID=273131 RepID=A0ABR4NUJ4_9SACH